MSYGMNSGYNGFSMSVRASEAYDNGEMPLSKWTKAEIISAVEKLVEDMDNVTFSMSVLKKAPVPVLRSLVLTRSSWHHTSMYVNETFFYSVDEDTLSALTDERISSAIDIHKRRNKSKPEPLKYKGTIYYTVWGGTRNYPTHHYEKLVDVNIEERGCFYIITDDDGKEILRKKMGSNGTKVVKDF